jgi:hypothetical protein
MDDQMNTENKNNTENTNELIDMKGGFMKMMRIKGTKEAKPVYLSPFLFQLSHLIDSFLNVGNIILVNFEPDILKFLDKVLDFLDSEKGLKGLLVDIRVSITNFIALFPPFAYLEEPINFLAPIVKSAIIIMKSAMAFFELYAIILLKLPLILNKLSGQVQTGGQVQNPDGIVFKKISGSSTGCTGNIILSIYEKLEEIWTMAFASIDIWIITEPTRHQFFSKLYSMVKGKIPRLMKTGTILGIGVLQAIPGFSLWQDIIEYVKLYPEFIAMWLRIKKQAEITGSSMKGGLSRKPTIHYLPYRKGKTKTNTNTRRKRRHNHPSRRRKSRKSRKSRKTRKN